MARPTAVDRIRNEAAIRAAMERLLSGDLPPGGKPDIKALAASAGVTRTGFYPKKNRDGTVRPGPYQHLAEEFERRLAALHEAGVSPDPRVAQIERPRRRSKSSRSGSPSGIGSSPSWRTSRPWRYPGSLPSMRRSSGCGSRAPMPHWARSTRCRQP